MIKQGIDSGAELLVEVSRGDIVERRHHGHLVVIDDSKKVIYSKGDPYKYTYMRSSAKPIQVLPVIASGAAQHFDFTDKEIAIICASHYAEPNHLETLKSIIKKIGLKESDLQCGDATSLKPSHAFTLAKEGLQPRPFYNDCSGKHLGMLAYTLFMKREIKNYLDPDHETQQDILNTFANFCEYPVEKISIGIDGCSAPVFALPLYNMAVPFLKLSNSSLLDKTTRIHADTVFNAMTAHPEMVAGSDGFCTELMKITKGKMIGKIGAEGVYCVGIKDRGLALAVKIEDGNMSVLSSVVIQVLDQFDVLSDDERKQLEKFRVKENLNDRQTIVGFQKPVI